MLPAPAPASNATTPSRTSAIQFDSEGEICKWNGSAWSSATIKPVFHVASEISICATIGAVTAVAPAQLGFRVRERELDLRDDRQPGITAWSPLTDIAAADTPTR